MEAARCVSVQHPTAAALPKAFGTGSSQGVPLQFDVPSSVWGLEMLSLIVIWSLQNDQMLSLNSLQATDRVLCRKVNWRECGGSTLVSVYVIAALSNDFPTCHWFTRCIKCAVLWMTFRVWDLSLNGFCVITSHFCLPLWADQMWSLSKQNLISELLRWLSPKLFIGFINTVNCLKSPEEVLTEIFMAD